MKLTKNSPLSLVMRTRCERCGCEGYIFPDQLKEGEEIRIRDRWYSKCCNGRVRNDKKSECLYFVESGKATRLQAIRRRETKMTGDAVANF